VSLKNTIVAHNTAPTAADCSGAVSSQGHNLDSDGSCALGGSGDLSGVDPKLGPLQDNGGPTRTQALLPGSPAIDAGDALGCPPTDQRGTARPQDGDGSGPAVCDVGAYELVFVPPPPPPNPLTISPASGVLVTTQDFDLVLTISAPGRLIAGGQAIFDGADVTLALLQCIRPGTLLAGGLTFRCPGLHGGLFTPGTHTFSLTVSFNTGPAASDTATWEVATNTEP
jgi:hypothetical protein